MHDPMAAFPDPPPSKHPWEALAEQARALADLADELAASDPAGLAPADGHDALRDLDNRVRELGQTAGICRRSTWRALRDAGWSVIKIGEAWGISRQKVNERIR